jgi:hypothetical protein
MMIRRLNESLGIPADVLIRLIRTIATHRGRIFPDGLNLFAAGDIGK